jgi:DNA excision repair protein ERCC-4
MRREKPLITFVRDTREGLPYDFTAPKLSKLDDGGMLEYALDAGDYSCELEGKLLPIRLERKTISDLYGVVGRGRERFERELEKLRVYQSYLVIEATAAQVRAGTERSLVSGAAAWGSVLCWSVQFGVIPIFAGDRKGGRDATQFLLEHFAVHHFNGSQ